MQIVHFNETDPGGVVYTPHNRGVVAWWQLRNDRRLPWVAWSVAAVLRYRALGSLVIIPPIIVVLPVIIRGNQISCAIVQFQGGISQCIGNAILRCTSSGPMARTITLFAPVP